MQLKFCRIPVLLLAFTVTAASAKAQTYIPKNITGIWEGIDSADKLGSIEFIDSIHLKLLTPDDGSFNCEYKFDVSKKPLWFDITLVNGTNRKTLKGLAEFLNDTTLKWQIFMEGERSNTFQQEKGDNTMLLRKRGEKK